MPKRPTSSRPANPASRPPGARAGRTRSARKAAAAEHAEAALVIAPRATGEMPSKAEVLAYIASEGGNVGKREIARAFGLNAAQKLELKALLADDGTVDRRRRRLHVPGALPGVVLADVVSRDGDGELIALPVEWDTEAHGEAPSILVQVPRHAKGPAPGIADRVLLRIVEGSIAANIPHVGRVVKVLDKAKKQTLGIFRALPQGGGRILPIDKKSLGRELQVPPGGEHEAQDGDLVSVELLRQRVFGLPLARVKDVLGSLASEKAVSLIALHAHGIPHTFPQNVFSEAEAARKVTVRGREDWRELPLVTIDPPDAKDHDDAVHAEPDGDPANAGGYIVTVAIADVAAYVRPGSALDREALLRGNSVYFPDRVVPMLPERISNDLCSLRPQEDRPALAVRMVIGKDGRKKGHSFHRVLMRSAGKLAYAQAQDARDGRLDDVTEPLRTGVIAPLYAAYACVKAARDARGPLDLNLPERKIVLKEDGTVDKVVVPERLDAHRLIEEFMILANVAAAETLEEQRTPLIYRVHDGPSMAKLSALRDFLKTVDLSLPKIDAVRPSHFNHILELVAETDLAPLVNQVVLRSQSQAEYAADNYGHFGLNLRRYAHFTSPIRRYADLVVHRALIRALGFGKDGLPEDATKDALAEVAAAISVTERRAMAAERETVDRLIAHHLADQIGAVFRGRITGATRAGLFVALDETGADGFIPAATLGADYYRFDEARQALVGDRTGEMHRLGDRVEVRLVEAAPVAGALRFELLSEGSQAGGGRGRPRPLRRSGMPKGRTRPPDGPPAGPSQGPGAGSGAKGSRSGAPAPKGPRAAKIGRSRPQKGAGRPGKSR